MVSEDLENQEKQYQRKLYTAYIESKNLFIRAEELLERMGFFVAPMIEHRDSLDHIMRYFDLKNNNGLTEEAIKELDRALAHELRAYFDIADFVCVTVRQEINVSLKRVSSKKIKKVWSDYIDIKNKVINNSEEIAKIRQNRNSSLEHIKKYKLVIEEMLDIYKKFFTKIEPQIRRNAKWK